MRIYRANLYVIFITCCFYTIFFCSCDQHNNIKVNKNHAVPDTAFLFKQLDSIVDFSRESDSINCYKRLSNFNNVQLAQLFPGAVYNAFTYTFISSKYYNQTRDSIYFKKFYDQLYDLALKSGSQHMLSYCELFIARNLVLQGKYDKALPLYISLLPKFKSYNDDYACGLIYKRIGLTYLNVYKEYSRAVPYLTQAFYLSHDKVDKSLSYDNLVITYFRLHEFDSLQKFSRMLEKTPVPFYRSQGYNTTYAFYYTYVYAYSDSGSIDSVKKYLNPCIDFYFGNPEPGYYPDLMVCLSAFCDALFKKHQYKLLDSLINITMNFEKQNPSFSKFNSEFYLVCYQYYEAKKDVSKALLFLKKYNEANKIINFEEQKSKVELARINYETEQEKLRVKNLQQQKEELFQQQLQKQKLIRNLLIAGSVFLLILIGLLINRHQIKRKMEMERMRSRLSRDLHDDIGSTLSSINILSRTAQSNLAQTNDDRTKASLEKINERSQRLLDSMSDIIWNINPGNDTIEEVMSRMREYATTILEAKNIDYTFNFPKEKMDCKLTMEVKNNMYLIFKEAVNNLSKYSGCSKVSLSLLFDEKNIQLIVEDNGIGFDTNKQTQGGGLINMNYRAAEIKGALRINSTPGRGTSVEVTMPRYC